ncbi:MAG: DUF72 domain-containing protein [Treponema sp.]|jgi:uncharacterized protein YecE (DUF72 family)|nr:DUF72 domain-containing protein [Treponema sp.]
MGNLLIGTSGYDYKDWKGGFYPDNLPQSKFLEYYSTQFNSLELNGTYYRMPTSQQMSNMIKRSGGNIRFSVKAFQDLTHSLDKSRYQQLIYDFRKALEPLLQDNLLLCVLFQFPESFHYDKTERIYLDCLLKEIEGIPAVVEMRNSKWQNDQVYNALRDRRVGWCISDNPKLDNLMKLDYVHTSDIAYLRFHGRNAALWYKGDNVTRYDYMYSDSELEEFVEPINELLKHTLIVQLFFNNHAKSQATINAKKIELLLRNEELPPCGILIEQFYNTTSSAKNISSNF